MSYFLGSHLYACRRIAELDSNVSTPHGCFDFYCQVIFRIFVTTMKAPILGIEVFFWRTRERISVSFFFFQELGGVGCRHVCRHLTDRRLLLSHPTVFNSTIDSIYTQKIRSGIRNDSEIFIPPKVNFRTESL